MKKIFLLLLLIPSLLSAQEPPVKIQGDTLYTFIINGIGQKSPIAFSIDKITAQKIKQSDDYKNTHFDTANINKKIRDYGTYDTLAMYLWMKIMRAAADTQEKLKYKISFTIPQGAVGRIFYTDEEGLCITFPFQAQNTYGGMIYATSYTDDTHTSILDTK